MTRDEAKALLTNGGRSTSEDEISRFLEELKAGVPIMPITFFCRFLRDWANLSGVPFPTERNPGENKARAEAAGRARDVFLQIQKSNLLWRTIYAGEPVRERPCLVHQGRWSGCIGDEETKCKNACLHGNNVTGWLPNEDERCAQRASET